MDALLHSLSVRIIKHIQKYVPTLGLELMHFVSEEYSYHVLTRSTTSDYAKNHPFAKSIRGSRASKPHASEN